MEYKKADSRYPQMELNNTLCENPKYWCRLHQVWMSEEDIKNKDCKQKTTFDMLGTKTCNCLEEKDYDNWIQKLKKKQ